MQLRNLDHDGFIELIEFDVAFFMWDFSKHIAVSRDRH